MLPRERPSTEFTIPEHQLRQITKIPLGFQPMGITSCGWKVAIADHHTPAVCLAMIHPNKAGLHFDLDWIEKIPDPNGKMAPLFSAFPNCDGREKAQIVAFDADDRSLWISTAYGRELFLLELGGSWRYSLMITLPGEGLLHSLQVRDS